MSEKDKAVEVLAIDIPELGNRTYLVHDGEIAVVIDPSRRIGQIIKLAETTGVRIAAVFETHIHNDYVSGGFALASQLHVPYYLSEHEHVHFDCRQLKAEQTLKIGNLSITALASAGHTEHHLSYLLEAPNKTPALFSGGSLLYGAVGRPDLVASALTMSLAKAQYRTAQFFVERLAPQTLLYPTHGFGSFCAASETEHVAVSTLKQQLATNHAYTAHDEASFIKELLQGLDDHPSYYVYMAPANAQGAVTPPLTPPQLLTKEALQAALHVGAGVVDMRSRTAYAARHLFGTYNIESGDDLATYVGWLIAWDAPLILVAATKSDVATAQEQLTLIGRDSIVGQLRPPEALRAIKKPASYAVRSFPDLKKAMTKPGLVVLDVRRRSEWKKGHVRGALHIPLHELQARIDEIPLESEVWVHCMSGFRASIAASMLSGKRNVVLINDRYEQAVSCRLVAIKKQAYVAKVMTGHAQLLDVRDDDEWDADHAKPAQHIILGRLLNGDLGSLKKDTPVYIYCLSGNRASMAEQYLGTQGYEAVNIGGLVDWELAGGDVASHATRE